MDLLNRIVQRVLTVRVAERYAGKLLQFPAVEPRVENKRFVKIHNVKYFRSNQSHLGSFEELTEMAKDHPNLIVGPVKDAFKWIWVLDIDRKILAMWSINEGSNKVWDHVSSDNDARIKRLDKLNQLNRVNHTTFVIIQRDMVKREAHLEQRLHEDFLENSSEAQQEINELVQNYFDTEVRSHVETAIKAIEHGARPLHYQPFGHPEDEKRHMLTSAISSVLSALFTESKVEDALIKDGFSQTIENARDNQAVHWAVGDVIQEVYKQYLPERAEDPEL
jgi:hypothetical protein